MTCHIQLVKNGVSWKSHPVLYFLILFLLCASFGLKDIKVPPFPVPGLLLETSFLSLRPVRSRGTWTARDSVNCRYLIVFLCLQAEELSEVPAHSVAWLEPRTKTQRHCFQRSYPLYGNSTAFLAHIPQALLLWRFFFSLLFLVGEWDVAVFAPSKLFHINICIYVCTKGGTTVL